MLFLSISGLFWLTWQQSGIFDKWLSPQPSIEAPEKLKPSEPLQPPSRAHPVYKPTVPRWLGYLLVASLLVLLSLGSWHLLKDRYKPERTELPAVSQIAARAATDLERGAELSDIVLRCYREMCDILSRKVRLSGEMTAREFVQHLQQQGVHEQEVAKLTSLFEHVRYGRYIAGPEERKEAIEALKAIEKQYRRSSSED